MSKKPWWGIGATLVELLESRSRSTATRISWFLLAGLVLLKVLILCTTVLTLAPDEAHYWEWSRRLDWAYYSKGPVVALLIAWSSVLFGSTEFAVRFPALITSLLFWVCLVLFLTRVFSLNAALVVFVFAVTTPFFQVLGLGMSTDPPALLGWVAGMWAAYEALFRGRSWCWFLAGALFGFATLSKYTAALGPVGIAIFCLMSRPHRGAWISPWAYGGALVYLLFLTPVLIWNAGHDWVNVAHNASHMSHNLGFALRAKYLPELFGTQLALLGPFGLVVLAAVLIWGLRRRDDSRVVFFLSFAVPLIALCLSVALSRRVYANWPTPAYVALFGLIPIFLEAQRERLLLWRSLLGGSVLLNTFVLVLAGGLLFGCTYGLSPHKLASKRMVGWDELGSAVEDALNANDTASIGFVVAPRYDVASAVAFYTPSHPRVMCFGMGERRMNQYDVWGGWEELRGESAVLVLREDVPPEELSARFNNIELASDPIDIEFGGEVIRTFYLYYAHEFDGRGPEQPNRF